MTALNFYEHLVTLTMEAPTTEISLLVLDLQVAIENLSPEQYDEFSKLFG